MSTIEENTVPWFKTSLQYGLYAGLISVIYSLLAYLFDFAIPTSIGMMLLQLLVVLSITVVILVLAIRHHRNVELGGFISFKRAFMVGWVALLVSSVISVSFQLLYLNVIDPEFVVDAMDRMEEFMEGFGLTEDQLEEQLENTRKSFTTSGILRQGFLVGPIISALFSAIVAAIMKKKDQFN